MGRNDCKMPVGNSAIPLFHHFSDANLLSEKKKKTSGKFLKLPKGAPIQSTNANSMGRLSKSRPKARRLRQTK
jgi:hypothetical protein